VLDSIDLRGRSLAVALSGGVDSVVLLHVLASLEERRGYELRAIHVDHGISPNARRWRVSACVFAAACGCRSRSGA